MRVFFAALVLLGIAHAVCLDGQPTVKDEYRHSAYVVIVKVHSSRNISGSQNGFFLDGEEATVMVLDSYKGKAPGQLRIFSENSSGRFPLKVGESYLLFIKHSAGRLVINSCGNSDLLANSKRQLASLKKLPSSA